MKLSTEYVKISCTPSKNCNTIQLDNNRLVRTIMYTVPVIPPDLRHEETIIQAANALDCLQSTITNIFDRIDKRISKNNAKINELSLRINSASLKIQNLSGTNKAIKIFSPAKFPSSHVFRDIELTFRDGDAITKHLQDIEIVSRVDPVPNNINDKLVFFHFRGAKNKSTANRVSSNRGLGDIPTNLKSVNSVLLFSTAENVFRTRGVTDEMSYGQTNRSKGVRKTENTVIRGPHIEPAPHSLSNRQSRTDKRLQHGLFYTPKLNEAPAIDLPIDLPDLPGIVDDIQFEHAESHQIAPSLFIENITDLPEITDTAEVKINTNVVNPSTTAQVEPTSINTKIPMPPPPPPPPPPPTVVSEVPSSQAARPSAPPPPPPPPLLSASTPSVQPKSPAAALTDVRSNLMDAIRKAGGARGGRLRAAADVARQESTEKLNTAIPNQPKTATSGDLMADLHNKLLMRRKGISGAKDGETTADNGNVISRLSSLIPPPPAKAQSSSSDEEGGDDADWAD